MVRREERRKETGFLSKILLFVTGTFIYQKMYRFFMNLFGSERQQRRPYNNRQKTDVWGYVKKGSIILGVVLVSGFLLFQLFTMLQEQIFYEMGDLSPGEAIGTGFSRVANATSNGINSVKVGVMTPFWRSQCQRRLLPQNPENYEQKLENCVREKQGLPPINDTESQREQEWELRNARNYLTADLYTEVVEADYMADVCGSRCGRVETVIRNRGSKPLELEEISLSLKGPMVDGNYPLSVLSENALEKGKRYRLESFIDGVGRLEDWTNTESMDEDSLTVLEGETKTVTFLVNLSRHSTFIRSDVVSSLEEYQEDIERNTEGENQPSIEDYCQERGGTYQGEEVATREGRAFFEQTPLSESFSSFSDTVCNDHVVESVESNTNTILGSEDVEPEVRLNYSGSTESVLNLQVWNREEWGNMDPDNRESIRRENCRTIGTGNTLKQTSETSPGDVVAFLMYTDCEILYSEEGSDSMILDIQAKADSSKVNSFRIRNVEELSETGSNLCDEYIDGTNPSELYTGSGWFRYTDNDWSSPTTACYIDLPQTTRSASLNLGISADYSASTTTTSVLRLD